MKKIILLMILFAIAAGAQALPTGWQWAKYVGTNNSVLLNDDSSTVAQPVIVLDTVRVDVGDVTFTADSVSEKPSSSFGIYSISVTTTPQQLGDHSASMIDLVNENTSASIYYSNASDGVYRELPARTTEQKQFANSNLIWVKVLSGTSTLIYEVR